ncbi:MAG: YraN family protein [Gammaproteobacteria bacterium]|nr:YraN family protein [Gammaproteobacteria bacterium]MDH3768755.1 YraN family protein [Gammaproteobacteria bacterium]
MNRRAARGLHAEKTALRWLKSRGLQVITCNYRCRHGELDLIMKDTDTVVVVEVRSRTEADFLTPALSIDQRKQGKIIRSTEDFLQRHPVYTDNAVRFDVVALTGEKQSGIEWIRDAFRVD